MPRQHTPPATQPVHQCSPSPHPKHVPLIAGATRPLKCSSASGRRVAATAPSRAASRGTLLSTLVASQEPKGAVSLAPPGECACGMCLLGRAATPGALMVLCWPTGSALLARPVDGRHVHAWHALGREPDHRAWPVRLGHVRLWCARRLYGGSVVSRSTQCLQHRRATSCLNDKHGVATR